MQSCHAAPLESLDRHNLAPTCLADKRLGCAAATSRNCLCSLGKSKPRQGVSGDGRSSGPFTHLLSARSVRMASVRHAALESTVFAATATPVQLGALGGAAPSANSAARCGYLPGTCAKRASGSTGAREVHE